MAADRARELEPVVAGSSLEAKESNQGSAPDRLGRTVLLAVCPALRLSAANESPLVVGTILCATSVFSVSLWCSFVQVPEPQRHREHRGCTEIQANPV